MNCRLSLPYLVIAGAESCVLFYCCGFCLNFVYRTWWFQRTCSPGVRQCRYILNSFIVLFPVGQCEIVYYSVVISTVAWFCSDRSGACCRVQWVWFCVVQCVGACMYVGALCHAPVVCDWHEVSRLQSGYCRISDYLSAGYNTYGVTCVKSVRGLTVVSRVFYCCS